MKKFNVYNSLTNKIEPLIPLKENEISMYVCGPTVYGDAHIGNCRPVIVFDVLYRLLTYVGYKVTYMSNITDVDDKIINKAIEEGVSEGVIAERYINRYLELRKENRIFSSVKIKALYTGSFLYQRNRVEFVKLKRLASD